MSSRWFQRLTEGLRLMESFDLFRKRKEHFHQWSHLFVSCILIEYTCIHRSYISQICIRICEFWFQAIKSENGFQFLRKLIKWIWKGFQIKLNLLPVAIESRFLVVQLLVRILVVWSSGSYLFIIMIRNW